MNNLNVFLFAHSGTSSSSTSRAPKQSVIDLRSLGVGGGILFKKKGEGKTVLLMHQKVPVILEFPDPNNFGSVSPRPAYTENPTFFLMRLFRKRGIREQNEL